MMRRLSTNNAVLEAYGRQIMEYLPVPAWHHGTANPVESAYGMSTKAGKGKHNKDADVLGA